MSGNSAADQEPVISSGNTNPSDSATENYNSLVILVINNTDNSNGVVTILGDYFKTLHYSFQPYENITADNLMGNLQNLPIENYNSIWFVFIGLMNEDGPEDYVGTCFNLTNILALWNKVTFLTIFGYPNECQNEENHNYAPRTFLQFQMPEFRDGWYNIMIRLQNSFNQVLSQLNVSYFFSTMRVTILDNDDVDNENNKTLLTYFLERLVQGENLLSALQDIVVDLDAKGLPEPLKPIIRCGNNITI